MVDSPYTSSGAASVPDKSDVRHPEPMVMMDIEAGSTHPSEQHNMQKSTTRAFRGLPDDKRLSICFRDVCAFVPVLDTTGPRGVKALCGLFRKKEDEKPKERQVLFNISGRVEPGEVLALMGPSGSGKSSLLTILADRSAASVQGKIHYNGEKINKTILRKTGFVSQDDLLYDELTVYETLYYVAMLRLPRTWSKASKLSRVDLVINGLGLAKCRDTIIGNHNMRGVSGGERKRVSIGHELLINPAAILLDEPTSGLDATTALKLVHTLRTLAAGGRTIIMSIHQPSSRLYLQVDKLLLLSDGHTLYYGDAHMATPWFERLGQPLPFGVSITDHILDLASSDAMTNSTSDLSCQLVIAFETKAKELGKDGIQADDMGLAPLDRRGTFPLNAGLDLDDSGNDTDGGSDKEQAETKWGATWFQQLYYLTGRSARTRRFTSLSIQKVVELISVSAISGLFWWQLGQDGVTAQSANGIGGLIFFMVLFMSFSALFVAVFTFPSSFNMLVKERQSGMYRLTAYYLARICSDIPMDMLLPTTFTIILYFMAGLRLDAGSFFSFWGGLMLTMFLAQSMGLLVGATVTNPQSGLTTCTVVMLLTMLIAGFYVRNIPVWIAWMKYLSFIFWGWNLLLKIQFHDTPMRSPIDCPNLKPGEMCSVATSDVFEVNVDASAWPEAGVLVLMLVFWRICVYLALRWKTTFKKTKVVSHPAPAASTSS